MPITPILLAQLEEILAPFWASAEARKALLKKAFPDAPEPIRHLTSSRQKDVSAIASIQKLDQYEDIDGQPALAHLLTALKTLDTVDESTRFRIDELLRQLNQSPPPTSGAAASARVFISYARKDGADLARRLYIDLSQRGLQLWMDAYSIPAGADWDAAIDAGLQAASVVLVVLTPGAIASRQVKSEWQDAADRKIDIIPILGLTCEVPRLLKTYNWIDFRDAYDAGLALLAPRLGIAPSQGAVPSPSADVPAAPPVPRKRALLVEDAPVHQMSIRLLLEEQNVDVTLAKDFDSALKRIRGERLDLITLDMQLDEMDAGGQHGMVLLDQINIHQRGVPVIIISGLTWSETQVRDFLRKYRAFDYVKKPFTPDSLRPILVEALNQES